MRARPKARRALPCVALRRAEIPPLHPACGLSGDARRGRSAPRDTGRDTRGAGTLPGFDNAGAGVDSLSSEGKESGVVSMKKEVRERVRADIKARRNRQRVRRDTAILYDLAEHKKLAEVERETVTTDAETEARALAIPMAAAHKGVRAFYQGEYEGLPQVEINERVGSYQQHLREIAMDAPPAEITWSGIDACTEFSPQHAAEVWCRVRAFAADELEGGERAARAIGANSPLELARYLAVRDYFIQGWNPQNGIEQSMIDMLAQSYSLFLYWTQISHERATVAVRDIDSKLFRELKGKGGWKQPYQSEADAVEQAAQMADRHNRLFLRTLRQLRDLRRYTPPVIVNNGGQVNVANQQVNVNHTD